jgi:hypothetical protein
MHAANGIRDPIRPAPLAAILLWLSETMLDLSLTGEAPELVDDEVLATTLADVVVGAVYLRS